MTTIQVQFKWGEPSFCTSKGAAIAKLKPKGVKDLNQVDVDTTANTKGSCLTKRHQQLLCAAVAQRVFTVASRGSRQGKSMSRRASGGKSIVKMTVASPQNPLGFSPHFAFKV